MIDLEFESRFAERYQEAKDYSATLAGQSLAERVIRSGRAEEFLASLSPEDKARLLYHWPFWARPKQRPPMTGHRTFLYLAGRGAGKNRTAAERIRERIAQGARSIAIVGATWRETVRYCLGGHAPGGSGFLDCLPPRERARWRVAEVKGQLTHPSGAVIYLGSDEAPEFARGANLDTVWLDEVAKWRHAPKLLGNLEFALRARGPLQPELIVTTTPRPTRVIKELVADPDTLTILGTSDENAINLDAGFLARLERKFGGSRMARQERGGEVLEDVAGALFSPRGLDETRIAKAPRTLARVAVAIDPAIATSAWNDETAIVTGGIDDAGHIYVLADMSGRMRPEAWAAAACDAYDKHQADCFVSERNRGGDLVAANLRATVRERKGPHAVAKIVEVQATRGKAIRAEPVVTLAEQGRIHIVGNMPELEKELTEWNPANEGPSPNRLDAFVWLCWHLANLGEDVAPPARDPRESLRGLSTVARSIPSTKSNPLSDPIAARAANPIARTVVGHARGSAWGSRL